MIDNSFNSELDRLVTWQYDNAPHLTGIIDLIDDFFQKAVTVPMGKILDLANLSELDEDWALNIWGRLLGLPRPQLEYDGETSEMSRDNYRNLLLARMRLLSGNGSTDDYVKYVGEVFDNNASFTDNQDMSATVTWETGTPTTDSDKELKALHEQYLDKVMLLPTGVCLAGDYNYPIFSIAMAETQKQDDRITNFNPEEGGCLYMA